MGRMLFLSPTASKHLREKVSHSTDLLKQSSPGVSNSVFDQERLLVTLREGTRQASHWPSDACTLSVHQQTDNKVLFKQQINHMKIHGQMNNLVTLKIKHGRSYSFLGFKWWVVAAMGPLIYTRLNLTTNGANKTKVHYMYILCILVLQPCTKIR